MNICLNSLRTVLLVAVLNVTITPCSWSADSYQPTDLSGVWQVKTPVMQLKTLDGKTPPLVLAAQKLYAENSAKLIRKDRSFDPVMACKPMGEPRTAYDAEGGPFEILVNSRLVLFSYTWNRMVRFVPITDAPLDVIGPAYYGTAKAKWQGSTLVIEAEGFHEQTLLDAAGMPHSEDLHMTQRFTLKEGGKTLEERIRFEDAKTFTQPWETVIRYQRKPGARIAEDVCPERIKIAY